MNTNKVKASWDIRTTKVFIDLCIEQVQKGERKGTSLTKKAWGIVSDNFTAKTGRVYEKPQFKNKYDSLRKEWQTWDKLLREIGLGWDTEKNTVSALDDWWEKKLLEVPNYKKFREKGLQFRDELTQLFGSVAATSPHLWAPSSMTLPNGAPIDDDMEEGFEDSDEVLGASIGRSGEFNSVTFNENSGGSGGNIGMRQETSRGCRTTGTSRSSSSLGVKRKSETMKKKRSSMMKITDALNRIAEANDVNSNRGNDVVSRALARREEEEARAYERSITGVMTHLTEIDEIIDDSNLFARCTQLLMEKLEAREMYAVLKNKRQQLVIFLKHATKDL